jgi:hypothetical protein
MVIPKLSHQQVIGSLRATSSTNTDVLFAKKEELLQETQRLKLLGIVPIVVGVILSITLVGAIVGVPMIVFGILVRKSYQHNLRVSDDAFNEYLRSIASSATA